MSEQNPEFYLVWCPTGWPPKYRHQTYESAEREAVRLARENPGRKFYVLVHAATVQTRDVEILRTSAAAEEVEEKMLF